MNAQSRNKLTNLVETFNDGILFYQKAKVEVDDPALDAIFNEMISSKLEATTKLRPWVSEDDTRDLSKLSPSGTLDVMSTVLSAMLSTQPNQKYVSDLHKMETRVLNELDEVIKERPKAPLKNVLDQTYRSAQMCHDRMKMMKEAA